MKNETNSIKVSVTASGARNVSKSYLYRYSYTTSLAGRSSVRKELDF